MYMSKTSQGLLIKFYKLLSTIAYKKRNGLNKSKMFFFRFSLWGFDAKPVLDA